MKVLVTGGAGFIGSHLTEALVENGDRVRVLDNFSTGRRENLEGCLSRIELIEGDIRSAEVVARAVGGIEVVFHEAALPSVPRSFADPFGTMETNAAGTLQLLQAAKKAGVKRFIFAASSSVYGDGASERKNEDLPPLPLSPYAVSKLAGEMYCGLYFRVHGFPTLSLRYFNVFGPRQDPQSAYAAVIPRFINCVLRGETPVVYGDGRQTRDFTYVENIVLANLKGLSAAKPAWGQTFNIACGEEISLLRLIDLIAEHSGRTVSPSFAPPRPGDIRHSRADISKAGALLKYIPAVLFPEGLKKTFLWFKRAQSEGETYGCSPA